MPWILNQYWGDELVSASATAAAASVASSSSSAAAPAAAASVAASERGEEGVHDSAHHDASERHEERGGKSSMAAQEEALRASAATRAMMRVIVPAVRPFVPQSPEGGLGSGPMGAHKGLGAHVTAAQADMLSLCTRHGTYRSPSQLVAEAIPLSAPGRTKPGPGERWQYGAFQTLLYGAEIYPALLRALPEYLAFQRLSDAASIVQRLYRNRVSRALFLGLGGGIERQRHAERLAAAKQKFRATMTLQRYWRARLLRRAKSELSVAADLEGKRARAAAQMEAAHRTAFKESLRLMRESALIMIQRRWRWIMRRKRLEALLRQARPN